MRRTLFIAVAVILALAGSAFAASSPYMDSRYRQLDQRVRVLATHTTDMPIASTEKLDWAALLREVHTVDTCDDVTFELTSHTITHYPDGSKPTRTCGDKHVGIPLKLGEHHRDGGWWEPYELQLGKSDRHDRIDLWGRTGPGSTAGGSSAHVV